MIIKNVTREALLGALSIVPVRADVRALNHNETRFNVKLFPAVPDSAYTPSGNRKRGEAGDAPYQRVSASFFNGGRRVNAVCWHGFRDYLRAVFQVCPEAVVRTAVATYNGSEHFEETYRDTAHKNIGSQIAPVAIAEACKCH